METWKESLLFGSEECKLIWNAFIEQAKKLWLTIIVENVLSDHVHIVIDSNDKPISEIVQNLKWYSSYTYNRTFNHKGPVWAVWYSDMCIGNEKYLENAVEYVKNNHLKHQSKSYYIWWESI